MAAMLDNINASDIRILLISKNEQLINNIIECYLFSGMKIDISNSAENSFRLIIENFYDIVILEISNNEKKDILFSKDLKCKFLIDIPIIAICSKGSSVKLYNNYLYDCCIDDANNFNIIRAYIISLVRRYRMISNRFLEYDDLCIDTKYYEAKYKNEVIKLPLSGIKFLYYLINKNPNILITDEIIHYLHGNKENGSKTFRSQLCRLKSYLKSFGWDNIETISHIGYRLKNNGNYYQKIIENKKSENSKILCLTSKKDTYIELDRSLSQLKFKYFITNSVDKFLDLLSKDKYEIVIIDLIVNSNDAITLTRDIREKYNNNTYIIVLVNDKVIGGKALYNGADDIISKPIENDIISSKIQFLMNKCIGDVVESEFRCNGLRINPRQHIAIYNESEIFLPPIPFYILVLLIKKSPEVVSYQEIKDVIFGKSDVRQNLIFCHTTKIRKELNRVGCDYIKTIPKIGIVLKT